MEKEVMKKMARYVELSAKFSKSEKDIFTEEELKKINNTSIFGTVSGSTIFVDTGFVNGNNYSNYITLNGPVIIDGKEIFVDEKGNVKAKDPKKELTRGEQLEATVMLETKARAVLLDEYDEYTKLRTSINNYFSGVNNLINE